MSGSRINFIKISNLESFEELQGVVSKAYLSDYSLSLIKDKISNFVKILSLEYPYVDKDFRSTFYSDFSKRHQEIDRNSFRVHLLADHEEYLGFFTLRNTPPFNLGRGYLSPKAIATKAGHFLLTKLESHILGKTFVVEAFPWMQQDANISRCAQVSIWAIVRYYSERYSLYAEYTLQQVFDLASSHTRKIPSKGLTIENISTIMSSIGFFPEVYFREIVNNKKLFNEIIYIFIESGIPFVAGLRVKRHAITIIGHLEIEKNDEKNDVITPISDLLKGYISVDDNYLPYSVVGEQGRHSIDDIDAIVVPLYEKMYLDALTLLNRVLPGIESAFLPHYNMYRRVFITSSKSFKKFIKDNVNDEQYKSYLLLHHMPKFIWIAEYIEKNEYPDNVHSRFIFDATAMEYAGSEIIILARIGNEFISNGKKAILNISQDPIYKNNLRETNYGMDE